jgi:hypothetical protein
MNQFTTQKWRYPCELLIRAKMVPAGSDTRVDVRIHLSALRGMDGASAVEEAWLRPRAGQPGYLAGKEAEAIACDAVVEDRDCYAAAATGPSSMAAQDA